MRRQINYTIIICALSYFVSLHAPSAVTYLMTSGRFGDQLLAYCHAKWIGYIYKIPVLYKPFKYSENLVLHICEERYDETKNNFIEHREVMGLSELILQSNILYVIPFFPESPLESCLEPFDTYYFAVDWQDSGFRDELKKMIYPLHSCGQIIEVPQDFISIALHVRKGTHFDSICGIDVKDLSDSSKGPLLFKIPPDSYYIDQIKKIAHIHTSRPLYVYIFTDHDNPQEIADSYHEQLKAYPVVFDFRKADNHHDRNVLEDFFSMVFTPFDYFIRPESHYSFIASKIGNAKIVISPKNFIFVGNAATITQVTIQINN